MTDSSVAREILIADDDVAVRKAYRALLESEGYTTVLARHGEEAVALFRERRPALVLLDVMMPHMNGIAACQEMRKIDALTPILFFTALPSEVSLVRGLGCGADDYIDKTRPTSEILARIDAALRRHQAHAAAGRARETLALGLVRVDLAALTVTEKNGFVRTLTRGEALILRELDRHRGQYVSCDQIADALYGADAVGTPTQVRKFVERLRDKLGPAGELIRNARGVGYRLLA